MPTYEGIPRESLEEAGRLAYLSGTHEGVPFQVAQNLKRAEVENPQAYLDAREETPERRVSAREEVPDAQQMILMSIAPRSEDGALLARINPFFAIEDPPHNAMRTVTMFDQIISDIPPELENRAGILRTCLVAQDLLDTHEGLQLMKDCTPDQLESLKGFLDISAELHAEIARANQQSDLLNEVLSMKPNLRELTRKALYNPNLPTPLGLWGYGESLKDSLSEEISAKERGTSLEASASPLVPENLGVAEVAGDVQAILLRCSFGQKLPYTEEQVAISRDIEEVLATGELGEDFPVETFKFLQSEVPGKDGKLVKVLNLDWPHKLRLYETLVAAAVSDSMAEIKGSRPEGDLFELIPPEKRPKSKAAELLYEFNSARLALDTLALRYNHAPSDLKGARLSEALDALERLDSAWNSSWETPGNSKEKRVKTLGEMFAPVDAVAVRQVAPSIRPKKGSNR